jgi:glycosyltransferase involved in cell wall biosynthesis
MKLSIIIPVFNESKTILQVIDKINKVNLGNVKKEIIIVDDFSTDGTREILKKLKGYKIIFHEKNMGKGAALRTGFSNAGGNIILIQDADLEYEPNDYPKLIQPIIDGRTKVVFGSRFLKEHKARYKIFYLGNILLSFITRTLYSQRITDMETCYKVFKKEVLKGISFKAERFEIEPEITAKIIKKGYKILEVPVYYKCRDFKEGKKISWKDGVKAIYYLIKYRFSD